MNDPESIDPRLLDKRLSGSHSPFPFLPSSPHSKDSADSHKSCPSLVEDEGPDLPAQSVSQPIYRDQPDPMHQVHHLADSESQIFPIDEDPFIDDEIKISLAETHVDRGRSVIPAASQNIDEQFIAHRLRRQSSPESEPWNPLSATTDSWHSEYLKSPTCKTQTVIRGELHPIEPNAPRRALAVRDDRTWPSVPAMERSTWAAASSTSPTVAESPYNYATASAQARPKVGYESAQDLITSGLCHLIDFTNGNVSNTLDSAYSWSPESDIQTIPRLLQQQNPDRGPRQNSGGCQDHFTDDSPPPNTPTSNTNHELAFCGNGAPTGNSYQSTEAEILESSWSRIKPTLNRSQSGANRLTAQQHRKQDRRRTTGSMDLKPDARAFQLHIVQEDGQGRPIAPTALTMSKGRPRRLGPLSEEQRVEAARHRKSKTVCIRCRQTKQSCDGESPCSRCRALGKATIWEQPCTKAHFLEIVESGTCNYISQRAINHLTTNGNRRIRLDLPATFELRDLLSLIRNRRQIYNIRARQASGSLYVLDLNECYRYLNTIYQADDTSRHDLGEFIDHKVLKADNWVRCVKDSNPLDENLILGLLSTWNNMPSRASYDFVPVEGGYIEQPMDVENASNHEDILIAAQLSRIICRKLEVAGYKALQTALNRWPTDPPNDQAKFVSDLGQILLTLRWRVSWWELLGDGGKLPDRGKQRYEYRVKCLCQILYFYYCNVKKKLPSWYEGHGLEGVMSTYPDASVPVLDDFPRVESIEGFAEWMERGKNLILTAQVRLPDYHVPAPRT